jgi:hypothetical protein
MKNVVFWDVAPCRPWVNRRSSETSVNPGSTQRHISENDILNRNIGRDEACYHDIAGKYQSLPIDGTIVLHEGITGQVRMFRILSRINRENFAATHSLKPSVKLQMPFGLQSYL